ncbi:MAG: methyltransferase, partial [Thermomicrobiales bacterium]
RNCRRVMTPRSTLLLIEQVIPPDNEGGSSASLMDLHMLVIHGGAERTAGDFATLLAAASFRRTRIVPTTTGLKLIEAAPA